MTPEDKAVLMGVLLSSRDTVGAALQQIATAMRILTRPDAGEAATKQDQGYFGDDEPEVAEPPLNPPPEGPRV